MKPGTKCPECKRVAGHHPTCSKFKLSTNAISSRPQLFNATSVLWGLHRSRNLFTFTLPSLELFTYQKSASCETTGDLAITSRFSKVLEAWSTRVKRSGGKPLSYCWVAEAQTKRQLKYGGIGDIHFHLIANVVVKSDSRRVVDKETLTWLQDIWCDHIGSYAGNCVHVDPIPDLIDSIPGYLGKYMGKGSQRRILSRKFAATRDLTHFAPISLNSLPQHVDIVNAVRKDHGDWIAEYFYLNTAEVLEQYGHHMRNQWAVNQSSNDPRFTPAEIEIRAKNRDMEVSRRICIEELESDAGQSVLVHKGSLYST